MADEGPEDQQKSLFTSRRSRRQVPMAYRWGLGVVLVLVLAGVAGWFWLESRKGPDLGVSVPPPDTAGPGRTTTPEGAEAGDPFVLPGLDVSDETVRRLVEGAANHPRLTAWLAPEDLVRRFVEAVVAISRGSSPAAPLEMLIPPEPFSVQEAEDRLIVDPRSYRRYDMLAEAVVSVDAREASEVYDRLLPLFQEAYRELGLSEESFEEVLARAIRNLLAVDVPERPLEVREAVGRYVYVDRSIESLTPAEKHLLRMGPENARRVQDKLREMARELDLPEPGEEPTPGGAMPG
jgi:hypothetical protein